MGMAAAPDSQRAPTRISRLTAERTVRHDGREGDVTPG